MDQIKNFENNLDLLSELESKDFSENDIFDFDSDFHQVFSLKQQKVLKHLYESAFERAKTYMIEEFAQKVQNWLIDDYSPELENWIMKECLPILEKWLINEVGWIKELGHPRISLKKYLENPDIYEEEKANINNEYKNIMEKYEKRA